MSVQRVHFPVTPAPLLIVKENDDSVELVIQNTSTLFEILKNSQPRSRLPQKLYCSYTHEHFENCKWPLAYNRPFKYASD
jgi:hypothetical protein